MEDTTTAPAQAVATQGTTHKHVKDRDGGPLWFGVLMADVIFAVSGITSLLGTMIPNPMSPVDVLHRVVMINASEMLVTTVIGLAWYTLRARHEAEMVRLTVNCGGDCSARYLEGYRKSISVMLLNIGCVIVMLAFKVLAK